MDAGVIRRANVKFKQLVRDEIRRLGLIKTGTMIRSVTSNIKVNGTKIRINLGVVYYYKFLDNGTKYIEAYHITDRVLDRPEFKKIIGDLSENLIDVEIEKQFKALKGASYESKRVIK